MNAAPIHEHGYDGRLYVPKGTRVTPRIEVIGVGGEVRFPTEDILGGYVAVPWQLLHGDSATVVSSVMARRGTLKVLTVDLRLESGYIVRGIPAAKLQKLEK